MTDADSGTDTNLRRKHVLSKIKKEKKKRRKNRGGPGSMIVLKISFKESVYSNNTESFVN